jgi:hypothetical protein
MDETFRPTISNCGRIVAADHSLAMDVLQLVAVRLVMRSSSSDHHDHHKDDTTIATMTTCEDVTIWTYCADYLMGCIAELSRSTLWTRTYGPFLAREDHQMMHSSPSMVMMDPSVDLWRHHMIAHLSEQASARFVMMMEHDKTACT